MKIVAWHLFNDYSGSPKVLATVLRGLAARGCKDVEIVTSGGDGALSGVECSARRVYYYRFSRRPLLTMWRYATTQILTFFMALRYAGRRDVEFYVNTLLPVGPALAGRLMGHRVVYHYHENADVKGLMYKLLSKAMQSLASDIICVSEYQASFLKRKHRVSVVHNSVPTEMAARLMVDASASFDKRRVLMLSSLKEYKGTDDFVKLASMLSDLRFTLVINDTDDNVKKWARTMGDMPPNLEIHSRINDVSLLYNDASVVVNLSNPRRFIETFGLTALEAMTAGLPVIVPPVGGIAEMVEEGVNGYRIDVARLDDIASRIRMMLGDRGLYRRLSRGALETSRRYSEEAQVDAIYRILNETDD